MTPLIVGKRGSSLPRSTDSRERLGTSFFSITSYTIKGKEVTSFVANGHVTQLVGLSNVEWWWLGALLWGRVGGLTLWSNCVLRLFISSFRLSRPSFRSVTISHGLYMQIICSQVLCPLNALAPIGLDDCYGIAFWTGQQVVIKVFVTFCTSILSPRTRVVPCNAKKTKSVLSLRTVLLEKNILCGFVAFVCVDVDIQSILARFFFLWWSFNARKVGSINLHGV